MILVQNHQQPLNGNRRLFACGLALLVLLGACSPKTRVLRSPDYAGGNVGGTRPETEKPAVEDRDTKKEGNTSEDARKIEAARNSVALVLPFQLNQIASNKLSKEDVDRSAIALDFYQGFQLGLDELAQKGRSFSLHVIDSRDDQVQNQSIASSDQIQRAALIVGPVFPKGITSFGTHLSNPNVVQVSPLAATRPQEFNLPNLVSLTPSIDVHRKAMIKRVADDYRTGDVVLVYKVADNSSQQFLSGFEIELKRLKPNMEIRSVTSISALNENLNETGANLIVAGTTDRFQLRSFVSNLEAKSLEEGVIFRLYGHPLWDRIDFSTYEHFADFHPVITAESHLLLSTDDVRAFSEQYYSLYGIKPSDHAYKGYDAAKYFGALLAKYGNTYREHITDEEFEGIFSSYTFDYNEAWGFVNNAVSFKSYQGSSFQIK